MSAGIEVSQNRGNVVVLEDSQLELYVDHFGAGGYVCYRSARHDSVDRLQTR